MHDGLEADLLLQSGSQREVIEIRLSTAPAPEDFARLEKVAALQIPRAVPPGQASSSRRFPAAIRDGFAGGCPVGWPRMNAIPARTVILGVTGSIAAHRAVDLASQLVKQGCTVRVVMTAEAQKFVTALPFKTLSRHPVITGLWEEPEGWQPPHIELADQASLLLVAPATALFLAKYAHGLADDALHCIALALNPKARVLVAPAMNGKMWLHPATQANVALLRSRGVEFIGPDEGQLACGYEGIGRMWAVEQIAARTLALLAVPEDAAGPAQRC